jgi:hypothetical protein
MGSLPAISALGQAALRLRDLQPAPVHSPEGLRRSGDAFRRLIDMAIKRNGTYLTYHRDATRPQIEKCYPQFAQFLQLKTHYDPEERFQSDWYRDYKKIFADSL